MTWKKVALKDFNEFIKNYPNLLTYDVTAICEPPFGSYNDFAKGDWPESMVAKIVLNALMVGNPAYNGELNEYYILDEE